MATVLVVDDHQPSLELLALVVKEAGHDVLEASDGSMALALATRWRPSVILLDMNLGVGGPDGWAVARQLKSDPCTAMIRIVAVSALVMPGDEQGMLDAGCDAYVSKPIHCDYLLWILEAAVAASCAPRRLSPEPLFHHG